MSFRGGLLADAIISSRALPIRIGLSDQPGEFCNGIAFSVHGLLGFRFAPAHARSVNPTINLSG